MNLADFDFCDIFSSIELKFKFIDENLECKPHYKMANQI